MIKFLVPTLFPSLKFSILLVPHNFIYIENMGNQICTTEQLYDFDTIIDPLSSQFEESDECQLNKEFGLFFEKIKKVRQVVDPRPNKALKWFQSKKFGFKMFGELHKRRPFGQCLFYFDSSFTSSKYKEKISEEKKSPVLITTSISKHYVFSANTLLIYTDKSYYIGEIEAKVYQIPRASGQGLLVTSEFIYEGEFQEGLPGGFGRYHNQYLQYVGRFKAGEPCGDCIEKSSNGMFIGSLSETTKTGYLITPDNKKKDVDQKRKTFIQL